MSWKEKYVEEIKDAVEYSCLTDTTNKIEEIIDKIYADGYADGASDNPDDVESKPAFDWCDLD